MERRPHWRLAIDLARRCGLVDGINALRLVALFALTLISALIDGLTVIVLVDLLTAGSLAGAAGGPLATGLQALGVRPTTSALAWTVLALLALRVLGYVAVGTIEGTLQAVVRRRIQERGLETLLYAEWESLRDMRVGQRAGALTEEAATVAKYFLGYVRAAEALLALIVLGGVAVGVSPEVSFIVLIAAVPVGLALRSILRRQARHSVGLTEARQQLAADMVERLTAIFHVKVARTAHKEIGEIGRHQEPLTRHEIALGRYAALVGSFTVLLPVAVLGGFLFWALLTGRAIEDALPSLAKIGTIGLRAAAGFILLASSWGNVSRLAGSLEPVMSVLSLPPERRREPFAGPLARVVVEGAVYAFPNGTRVGPLTAELSPRSPLVVRGPSGSGKSTMANLVIGLTAPTEGRVRYVGANGTQADASAAFVPAAYVTQDVHLFEGSVRANLDAPAGTEDAALWKTLDLVNAGGFVRDIGGLDALVTESGRSLSGGQKRRLGIARALLQRPQLLIFDEITTGLDSESRKLVKDAVIQAANEAATLIITHEEEFHEARTYRIG